MPIPIQIPNIQDRELYNVLRQLSLLAVKIGDILSVGTTADMPATGKRKFYYATDDDQLYFYTGTKWKVIG